MRYRWPVQVMFRQTKQAVELHGATNPRDAFLLVAVGAASSARKDGVNRS